MADAKDPTLYPSTSQIAGAAHARVHGTRRQAVLAMLRARQMTLWEAARAMGVADHQISGVFTALARDLWIERTGERRNKPETGCPADVWRLCTDAPAPESPAAVDKLGYPATLLIGGEMHDRQELLAAEAYPALPYVRRADSGGTRTVVRVQYVDCPGCGRPLYLAEAKDPATGQAIKRYRCGHPDCGRTWRPQLVQEPGRGAVLALVMEFH